MRLAVEQIIVVGLHDDSVQTDQWRACVFDGKRRLYSSVGYHYATEARKAGLRWMADHSCPSSRIPESDTVVA